ncbi:LemA family protein [Hydromonas duriensis]|uniref:LemA protein n=1 Tax=Hydromonas duriensis TaxID=1527608 RepID=A0A4R6Y8W3_9BURK|nr:LemA family protein [Hydromonas duriensis]TDR31879.1 LemA protein [Hydromonas duriensis]
MRKLLALIAAVTTLTLSGCGYNTMQAEDEAIKAKWSEVLNQYQRRIDLIPNIVKTAQAEANFEKGTLEEVIMARASATNVQATPELVNDPEAFKKFTEAQGLLQGSLSRLMVVAENYPNLKSNQAFQEVRAQLEGTENRIAVARKAYIDAVQAYNTTLRTFPNNLTAKAMGYTPKANFTVENEAALSKAPSVEFDSPKK